MIIITGTYPPEKCGVGDYTYHLLHTKVAVNWNLFYTKDWSLKTIYKKIKKINSFKDSSINIQYPSVGYGYSLVPHFLCVFYRLFSNKYISVTLHEFTQLGWKGKISVYIFLLFAKKLIFTNEFEQSAASKYLSFLKRKSSIIKIYSNIPCSTNNLSTENRKYDIGYFGYLRPLKGLEEFVSKAKVLLEKNPNLSIYVMGQTQPLYKDFFDPILEELKNYGIILYLNKEMDEVADILVDTKIAYLPFPDGVSERRGSFLAVIRNGCIVVTTKGKFTNSAHEKVCFISDSNNAVEVITSLLKMKSSFYYERTALTEWFLNNEVPKSWEDVAEQYYALLP